MIFGGLSWICGSAWSSPLRDVIRALLLFNDPTLGWLTSPADRRFISSFRINVCLSNPCKAASQGSQTAWSFIRFIYSVCPCASLSFFSHLTVHSWSLIKLSSKERKLFNNKNAVTILCALNLKYYAFSYDLSLKISVQCSMVNITLLHIIFHISWSR